MKGIITVLGKDRVGIIAKVCIYLSEQDMNILDISQTIVHGYFNMMMVVDISKVDKKMDKVVESLNEIGKELGVDIKLQREDIFQSMHRM